MGSDWKVSNVQTPKEALEIFQLFPISLMQNLKQILALLSVETSRVRSHARWAENPGKRRKPLPDFSDKFPDLFKWFAPTSQSFERNSVLWIYRIKIKC